MFGRAQGGEATIAGRPIAAILREAAVETPAYVYDVGAMQDEAHELKHAFGAQAHLVAYAVKANSAGAVMRALLDAGCGAEVGSLAELELALEVGVPPEAIIVNGVAKTDAELDAAVASGGVGVCAVQIDHLAEILRLDARAVALDRPARVSLRINPNVRADTHAGIATGHDEAKFGIALEEIGEAVELLRQSRQLLLVGLGIHIGSQLTRTNEYLEAARVLVDAATSYEAASGDRLELFNLGGGFGVDYGEGSCAPPAEFARDAARLFKERGLSTRLMVVEPGRALVASHGVLVASVLGHKTAGGRRYLLIDAGMNDLLRPALYGAHHRIEALEASSGAGQRWNVVGPVCESSCDFGTSMLPDPPPSHVVIRDAGAYGYSMASHYNGRPLPAEIFVARDGTIRVSRASDSARWLAERLAAG
jgi:diaminopimelate decarboxylase